MNTRNNRCTRRAVLGKLAGISGLAAATQVGGVPGLAPVSTAYALEPEHAPDADVPIRGKSAPGLEPFDKAVLAIMDHHGIPGAGLALAREGRLVLAKGYGWVDVASDEAVEPTTLFGLASVSKPFTTVGVLLLVEQGKFGLDDSIFKLLNYIKPPPGFKVDPRLGDITVRHCLNHSAGWDRSITGDSTYWEPQICRVLHVRPPVTAEQLISFVMAVPLQFDPGTKNVYSNIGFNVMGELIARYSGKSYERFLLENVMKPMDIKRMALHRQDGKYLVKEARRHLPGTPVTLPPVQLPMIDASGGWSGCVVDLVRFLTNIDGSRGKPVLSEKARRWMFELPPKPLKPRDDGTYFGLGWDSVALNDKVFGCSKEGSLPGMRTLMRRKFNGMCWAMLFNSTMDFDQQDSQVVAKTIQEVHQLVESFDKKYADFDLFGEYP
jgi:CubicO group peptidase (beta-lactamase class C family)